MSVTMKQQPIRAILNFRRLAPEVVLTASTNIYNLLYKSADYTPPKSPAPPVDAATLKAANDELAAANAAAVDGGKQALARQKHAKEQVVILLLQLGHYAEANCKGDMTAFLTSGFTAASTTKTKQPPVSEKIRTLKNGPNSGQMLIRPMAFPGAASYEVRWAPVPAGGGAPATWSTQPIVVLRPATVISGLTPATNYVFQVRAVLKSGYTDWSDPLTRIAI